MTLRCYQPQDGPVLARLFYDTVHAVACRDYTPAQLDAWATGQVDLAAWNQSFLAHHTLVALKDGQIVGFADMDETGYLDRLYVHKDYQRQGVATTLCDALESACAASCFTTHASLTARPFMESRGYQVERCQQVQRHGVWLTNFVMKKANKEA